MDSSESFLQEQSGGVVVVREPTQKKPVSVQLVETNKNPSGLQLVDTERTTKCSDPTDLVELARQVQKAEEFVRARAVGRLEIIAEQIRHLQEQAKRVLQEAKRDDALHHAACNFKKIPGSVYYLYERPSGQQYFSLISPEEWGKSCPNHFLGCYRLEGDMSWTPAEKVQERTKEIDLMDSILNASKTFSGALEYANPIPMSEQQTQPQEEQEEKIPSEPSVPEDAF